MKAANIRYGFVKWFRDDGTGYIVDSDNPSNVYLVHYSAIRQSSNDVRKVALSPGQKVKFKTSEIIGNELVLDVWPIRD